MSWETLAYTDAGIELLMDAVSGKQLTITQAVGGSGLANAAVLHAQTDVTGERHALELLEHTVTCSSQELWASSLLKKTAALPAA